jgi:hypothetical protein
MILTPIPDEELLPVLERYASALPADGLARRVFARIAASRDHNGAVADWHRDAVGLAERFGMRPLAEAPQAAFSWDGRHVRTESEPAVLIHEVAHYQLASPARRFLPDFGLGAGPETGRIEEADQARCLSDEARELEEQLASLLGILWELTLGQPGILAFQEQNWLEGAGRPSAAAFLVERLARLTEMGLIDHDGTPTFAVRISPDAPMLQQQNQRRHAA